MTPGELAALLEAHSERAEAEEQAALQKIYLLSGAVRTAIWGKSMPSFKEMFPREMSDEEMLREAERLTAMYGGEEK